ncbi:glycoside hydrolase family 127 protein [Lentzea sp. BCCO 10_0856]|uniref:Glycoside hydrolase family 127 protein n=1 Tax=Lentzea miocenica TaxID=3095431 RepID=A0ABU4TEP9_9PSEU|nr:beta-L-arabinofuranosidase domain-containing protein [Lentzea sp. BCCO 10_0856]MDX8036648.1 glycoside hydrolase family 127 protein [Lentzea sp. BCCO 10_0856]
MADGFARRDFLRATSLAAAVPLLGVTTGEALAAPNALAPGGLRPFELSEVALGEGVFSKKRDLVLAYARGYDVNRLLQVFRANAGLDTLGAVAPGGWEGLDGEANGNLRGHYTGHFLSMLSQAYGSTGDTAYLGKIQAMVGALTECRAALRRDPRVLSVPGKSGRAVEQVRGSYQFVDLPAEPLPATFTFSAWVRPSHDANWTRIFDFGDDTTRYLYLAARNGTGVPRFAITTNGPGAEQGINGSAPLPLNEWSHIAVTIAGTTGTLYVNGVQAGANTAMSLNPAALGSLAHHWLGRSHFGGDPVFAGAFDEVNLFSRALTAEEITLPLKGDLASYSFGETTGGTFADGSGRGRTATLRRTWGGPSHPGFLAAYPETQFITLETMTRPDYQVVWAPYYTAHKILKGLVDAYRNTQDARALDLADGLCDWMFSRLGKLSAEVRQRMWGIFSSGEFGGIVEAIMDLHAITGKHLELARLFDLDSLITACAENRDVLDGLHANQHIPIFTGLVRLYEATGEQRYWLAATNFWTMVVPPRMFSIGGTSTAEFWRARGVVAGALSDTAAETCCAHNMLKLSRQLFLHEQSPKYFDYYERALYNQILGSKQDRADAELPLMTYFIGLTPGAVRDFTPKQGTTCCEGTGMESATKYQDSVYLRAADDSRLYVNLYSPSVLKWKGVTVTQTTGFPVEQGTTLRIRGRARFDLALRVPAWAGEFTVTVNGERQRLNALPGTYVTLSRSWRDGDVVRVRMPFALRAERTPDQPLVQSLMYGPIHLVARDARREFLEFGLLGRAALSGDLAGNLQPIAGSPLHFRVGEVELAPFFEGTEHAFHSYFRRAEPKIVFAGVDSGVANPVRVDGSTFLDEVWLAAPFSDKKVFVDRVTAVARKWVSEGLMSVADHDRVIRTARNAPIR